MIESRLKEIALSQTTMGTEPFLKTISKLTCNAAEGIKWSPGSLISWYIGTKMPIVYKQWEASLTQVDTQYALQGLILAISKDERSTLLNDCNRHLEYWMTQLMETSPLHHDSPTFHETY